MSGRVFPGSANLIEDQAAILFDYLSRAASVIVAEEMRIEGEIAKKQEERIQTEQLIQNKRRNMIIYFGLAAVALVGVVAVVIIKIKQPQYGALSVLPVGLGVAGLLAKFAGEKLRLSVTGIETAIRGFGQAHAAIRRDYRVHKLGVAYVPVAVRIPFDGNSFLLDHTGITKRQDFNLYMVRDQDAFVATVRDLEDALVRIPLVEGSTEVEEVDTGEYSRSIQSVTYYDYFGNLDRSMRTAAFQLNDLECQSVSMPVIDPAGPYADFLKRHGTSEPTDGPVVKVFPTDSHADTIGKFQALYEMKKAMEGQTAQFEEFLQDLMVRMASTVQKITRIKIGSANHVVEYGNQVLFRSLKASYNHYSPQLEAEEIERIRGERFDFQESVESYQPFNLKSSSLVRYDAASDNWVSDDGRRTSFPFGVHQIHEEIVAPLIQNLMNETRIERMKIYNGIKDQKIDYLNQWHRDTDDFYGRNRAEGSDLINLMQGSLTEFIAALNQFKTFAETEKNMSLSASLNDSVVESKGASAESVLAYERKMGEFRAIQDEFNDYVDRLKEEIDRRAEEFGYIEFFDASLRDTNARAFANATATMGSLDDRRKGLLAINPYFAAAAELPPQPDMDESAVRGMQVDLVGVAQEALDVLRAAGGEERESDILTRADFVNEAETASPGGGAKPANPSGRAAPAADAERKAGGSGDDRGGGTGDGDSWTPPPPPPPVIS